MAEITIPDPSAVDASNASMSQLTDTTNKYVDASAKASTNSVTFNGNLESTTNVAQKANLALSNLDDISKNVSEQFKNFGNILSNVGVSISNMNNLSEQQARALGIVSASVLGVQKQFRGLADDTSLSTFERTLSTLKDTAENRNALLGVLSDAVGKVNLPAGIGESMELLKAFAKNILTSSDNATHAQNSFIQMSAAAGNLEDVFTSAGPNLQNLNKLMAQQIDIINQTANATGLTGDITEKYWGQLGKIPGALTEVVRGTTNVGGSMSMLTATIAFARGTGRSYESVLQDLNTAYKNFGVTGNDAFKLLSNIGEVANKTGTSFESMHENLMNSASGLKEFASGGKSVTETMTGLSNIMTSYVQSLKSTGLSADVSAGIIKNMTDRVANLTTAQKAFISAQTGGPGGLMGAAQIDMMLRSGQIEKVFEKVRATMQRQFGTIVTQEQAATNEFAARQFEKQKLLLQRGPLGPLAQTDQQAARLLEAFKARQEGRAVTIPEMRDKTPTILERGLQLQREGNNILTRIATGVEANQRATDLINKETLKTAVIPLETKEELDRQFNDSLMRGARAVEQAGMSMKSGTFNTQMVNEDILNNIKGMTGAASQVPNVMSNVISTGINTVGGVVNIANNERTDRERFESDPRVQQQRVRDNLEAVRQVESQDNTNMILNRNISPGGRLTREINTATRVQQQTRREERQPVAVANVQMPRVDGASAGKIDVHVKGYCLKCQHEIMGGEQMVSVSPATRQTP